MATSVAPVHNAEGRSPLARCAAMHARGRAVHPDPGATPSRQIRLGRRQHRCESGPNIACTACPADGPPTSMSRRGPCLAARPAGEQCWSNRWSERTPSLVTPYTSSRLPTTEPVPDEAPRAPRQPRPPGARCDACHARHSHVQRSQDGLLTVCRPCARGVDLSNSDASDAIAAVTSRAPATERRALTRRLLARRTMHLGRRERRSGAALAATER
jgi:hypothetical protein